MKLSRALSILLIFSFYISYGQNKSDSLFTHLGYSTIIESKILNETKKILIHLPFEFDVSKEYPLIVLSDLMSFKPFSSVTEIMAYNKTIPACIVVCPLPNNVRNDYSPIINDTSKTSNGGKTIAFYEKELLPYLRLNYKISKTILWGQNYSGMFTSFVMLTKPGVFDGYLSDIPKLALLEPIINSDSVFANMEGKELFYQLSWTKLVEKNNTMKDFIDILEKEAPENLRWNYTEENDSVMITHFLTNYTYGLNLFFNEKDIPGSDTYPDGFDIGYTKKVLTAEINKILNETGIPSVSLALIKDDSIVWAEAFGYANVKNKVPATSSTIYCTGSNFKFVTATAIMQLADAGKINLDDPVNNYLGELAIEDFSSDGTQLTFRHLLSHHSGLSASSELTPLWERKLPITLDEFVSEIKATGPPGENFEYCNQCFALAGLVIEKVSGQSFQDYIIDNILEPLQIELKGPVTPTPGMVEELALPYSSGNNESTPQFQYRSDDFPAGEIYLTSSDMAKFYIAQLNQGSYQGHSILSPKSIAEMQKPQFGSIYGLGTRIFENDSAKFLQHTGSFPGYCSFFKVEVNSKAGIYIVSNAGSAKNVLKAISDLALNLLNGNNKPDPLHSFAKERHVEIELTEAILKNYTGKYQLTPEIIVSIVNDGNHLYVQHPDSPKFELFPFKENMFFLKVADVQIRFNTKNGNVNSLTLFQNGELKAQKIE